MNSKFKRVISLLLVMIMTLGNLPSGVIKAEEILDLGETEVASGGAITMMGLGSEEPEEEPTYVLATDADFKLSYGDFVYIGTDEYVEIPHVIQDKALKSYRKMFARTFVKGVKSTNKNVTSTESMFEYSKAETLDLRNFDTSNVTNMKEMFNGAQATELDLSNFDTSNVANMSGMFLGSKDTELDLISFDTSNVTDMSNMFRVSQATELDLRNFDTSNVTNMKEMFAYSKATELGLSSFDTSKVTNMSGMFLASQDTELDFRNFDTSNVTDMSYMFSNAIAPSLDLSDFDTSNVTNMSNMFSSSKATTLDLSSFDTSKVTNMSGMFWASKSTTLDLSSFDTSKVTNMSNMFYNSQATTGYARTLSDAQKFNATSNKPQGLVFIIEGQTYTVKYVDYDGSVLYEQQVAGGGTATPPDNPTRAGYTFDSWNHDGTNITGDITITATYRPEDSIVSPPLITNDRYYITIQAQNIENTVFKRLEYSINGKSFKSSEPIVATTIDNLLNTNVITAKTVAIGYGDLEIYSEETTHTVMFKVPEPESEEGVESSWKLGPNITAVLDEEGTLSITGYGSMNSFKEGESPYFSRRDEIKNVLLFGNINSIGNYTFYGLENLKNINIPSTVQTIYSHAFAFSGLESITIPGNTNLIGQSIFLNCKSLKEVVLQKGTYPKMIQESSFRGCSSLTSVSIPDNISHIKDFAFYDCTSLDIISIENADIYWGNHVVSNNTSIKSIFNSSAYIYAKDNSINFIATEKNWQIGTNVFGSFDEYGVFTISGTGKMNNYTSDTLPYKELQSRVKKVVVEEGVTSIGNSAFYYFENLSYLEISNTVTEIGRMAFHKTSLTNVSIPKNVKTINQNAFNFYDNAEDTSITIHNERVYLYPDAIIGNQNTVIYSKIPSAAYALWHQNNRRMKFVEIQEEEIPIYVEPGSWQLGENVLGELSENGTLTISGEGDMFDYSSPDLVPYKDRKEDMTKVIIQKGITKIGNSAFNGFPNLNNVTIPEGVINIGNVAFYECPSLKGITIPKSVTTIGTGSFMSNAGIGVVILNSDVATQAAYAMKSYTPSILYSWENSSLKKFCSSRNIGFASLGYEPENTNEEAMEPNTFKLGENAIGRYEDGVLTIEGEGTIDQIYDKINDGSRDLINKIIIKEGIKVLGSRAFYNIYNLKEVEIPNSLTEIGEYAFYNCTLLEKINLPDSITKIGRVAFHPCKKIRSLTLPSNLQVLNDIIPPNLENLVIKNSLMDIPESLNIDNSIVIYGLKDSTAEAYADSKGLVFKFLEDGMPGEYKIKEESWDVGPNLKAILNDEGTLIIRGTGKSNYYYMYYDVPYANRKNEIYKVIIEDGVENIGRYFFYDFEVLTEVEIGNSVKNIEHYAFYGCETLNSITIPGNVELIGPSAFGSTGLRNLKLNNGLKIISDGAFEYSNGIKNVIIPETVNRIGGDAFGSLENIYLLGPFTTIKTNSFESTTKVHCWDWSFAQPYISKRNIVLLDGNEEFDNNGDRRVTASFYGPNEDGDEVLVYQEKFFPGQRPIFDYSIEWYNSFSENFLYWEPSSSFYFNGTPTMHPIFKDTNYYAVFSPKVEIDKNPKDVLINKDKTISFEINSNKGYDSEYLWFQDKKTYDVGSVELDGFIPVHASDMGLIEEQHANSPLVRKLKINSLQTYQNFNVRLSGPILLFKGEYLKMSIKDNLNNKIIYDEVYSDLYSIAEHMSFDNNGEVISGTGTGTGIGNGMGYKKLIKPGNYDIEISIIRTELDSKDREEKIKMERYFPGYTSALTFYLAPESSSYVYRLNDLLNKNTGTFIPNGGWKDLQINTKDYKSGDQFYCLVKNTNVLGYSLSEKATFIKASLDRVKVDYLGEDVLVGNSISKEDLKVTGVYLDENLKEYEEVISDFEIINDSEKITLLGDNEVFVEKEGRKASTVVAGYEKTPEDPVVKEPEEPEEPETPIVPEEPEEPEEPETPKEEEPKPEEPKVPETPYTPSIPTVPSIPHIVPNPPKVEEPVKEEAKEETAEKPETPKVEKPKNEVKPKPVDPIKDGENLPTFKMHKTIESGSDFKIVTKQEKGNTYVFKSKNPKVASVKKDGTIVAKSKGNTEVYGAIYKEVNGKNVIISRFTFNVKIVEGVYNKTLNLKDNTKFKKDSSLITSYKMLEKGKSTKVSLTGISKTDKLTYKVSDKSIISVSKDGKVKAKKKGFSEVLVTVERGKTSFSYAVLIRVDDGTPDKSMWKYLSK